jgi:hypothetical protein
MSTNNDLMLDVSQAAELKLAFRRNGWNNAQIKTLSEGDILAKVLQVITGQAEIKLIPESVRKWREENNVIYFSVLSDGTTGEQWIVRLESKGYGVSDYAKSFLRSADFKPTSGVTTEIAVLKGVIFKDVDRVTKKIRKEASVRKFFTPNAEVACLIREMFTDEEIKAMGLGWIVIHKPIKDSDGDFGLLGTGRADGRSWLGANYYGRSNQWSSSRGFAFAVSEVELDA